MTGIAVGSGMVPLTGIIVGSMVPSAPGIVVGMSVSVSFTGGKTAGPSCTFIMKFLWYHCRPLLMTVTVTSTGPRDRIGSICIVTLSLSSELV